MRTTHTTTGSEHPIKVIEPKLPKGGGDLKGLGETFTPHEFSGTAGLAIPISATECRGFTPSLAIQYSSGGGNGPFGLGCDLSLPEISRQTSKRIPTYDDRDTFLHSGADCLVPVLEEGVPVQSTQTVNGVAYLVDRFRPRTDGAHDRIERFTHPDDATEVFWKVTSPSNVASVFGFNPAARVADSKDPGRIYKWLLEEIWDDKGNHQMYTYLAENGQNIVDSALAANRDTAAQRYPGHVFYGNDQPYAGSILLAGVDPATLDWHFEIAFDYGQYSLPPENHQPYERLSASEWACRQDPFSDYRAGFEIRTYRLCRRVLSFHRFPEAEFGTADPVLVSALTLDYEASPTCSLLAGVTHSGFHYDAVSKTYARKSLPPLELGYSAFPPADPEYRSHPFAEMTREDGAALSGLTRAPHYRMVDLFGGGISGLLYADGQTVRYREPKTVAAQGIAYGASDDLAFPLGRRDRGADHTLADVTGDGHLDLLVSDPTRTGFFEMEQDETWSAWHTFDTFPSDFHDPLNQQVDVTGNGQADLLQITKSEVRVYPAEGERGYGEALRRTHAADLPLSSESGRQTLLTFADMCGLGPAQLVRVRNGLVECWPSLGYGTFGKRVVMANAPDFGPGFDKSRLRLADVDGSGTTDLAYIGVDHVDIYLNQSGNGFANHPIRISLPVRWTPLDHIEFADVRGGGTQCLVMTTAQPAPKQWYYDFSQTQWIDEAGNAQLVSQKPYLLTETINNMGAKTRIRYASSTEYYLEDKKEGQPWITRLPFPVQVIQSITHLDLISNTTTTRSYRYHHGFYDGFAREFRGFGRVDRTDARDFSAFDPEVTPEQDAPSTPPTLTKTWYHTGAWLEADDLLRYYREHEYWNRDLQADPLAHVLPATLFQWLDIAALWTLLRHRGLIDAAGRVLDLPSDADALPLNPMFAAYRTQIYSVFQGKTKGQTLGREAFADALDLPLATDPDADDWHEAYRVLHGSVLHSEFYGNDGTRWADVPYTISDAQFAVAQVQPKAGNHYGVYGLHRRQSIHYDYGRNAADPRVEHDFSLARDPYGQVLKACKVRYPRRKARVPTSLDPQTAAQQTELRVVVSEHKVINTPELPAADFYMLGIPEQSKSLEITGGLTPDAPNGYFTFDGIASHLDSADHQLWHWSRSYYFDADTQTELALGRVAAPVLLHRSEAVAFDKTQLAKDLGGTPAAKDPVALLSDAQVGYVTMSETDPDGGPATRYLWNPGSAQTYRGYRDFYVPEAVFDPLQYPHVVHGAPPLPADVPRTSYAHDPYRLVVTEVTNPVGHRTQITRIDYQRLAPVQMLDIDGNTSEVLFDPLGMVVASSFYGTETGRPVGFAPLRHYEVPAEPNLADIMAKPEAFLQQAATFFYYDLFSWAGGPVSQAQLAEVIGVDTAALRQCLVRQGYLDVRGMPTKAFRRLDSGLQLLLPELSLTATQKRQVFDRLSGTPNHFAALVAEDYPVDDVQKGTIRKAVTYSDGFGRHLQSKAFLNGPETVRSWDIATQRVAERQATSCWLTSGAVRYDDKGRPIQKFEPFFSPDYLYVNEKALNRVGSTTTLFYGATGHAELTLSPQGFLTKTLAGSWLVGTPNPKDQAGFVDRTLYGSLPWAFGPSVWQGLDFDANDTVEDSGCYRTYLKTGTSPSQDVDGASLDKARPCFNTPVSTRFDNMGRVVESRQVFPPNWQPPLGETMENQQNATFRQYDLLGNLLATSDQRLRAANKVNSQTSYSLAKQVVKQFSADGGTTWTLVNAVGHPFWHYDSRGTTTRRRFDVLQRPVTVHVSNSGDIDPGLQLDQIVERTLYSDSRLSGTTPFLPDAFAGSRNVVGRPVLHFDGSGLSLNPFFSLHGQPLAAGKVLTTRYQTHPDWDLTDATLTAVAAALQDRDLSQPDELNQLDLGKIIAALEATTYATTSRYDALGRPRESSDPDGNTLTPQYDSLGRVISSVTTAGTLAGKGGSQAGIEATPHIDQITYNAKGQPLVTTYGNGVETRYHYDPHNFRLVNLTSVATSGEKVFQDLTYHHDPVGNVTSITDEAMPRVFFKNAAVQAKGEYRYDTLYRLRSASGREHTSMWQNMQQHQNRIQGLQDLPTAADPVANGKALQNYTQTYRYDAANNLISMRHRGANVSGPGRTMTIAPDNNRLHASTFGQQPTKTYSYDAHGNQQTLLGLDGIRWDYRNRLARATTIARTGAPSDTEYYVYDAGGKRVRKVTEKVAGGGVVHISEAIYLGPFEIRRKSQTSAKGATVTEEWHWTQLVASCRWGYQVLGKPKRGAKPYQLRYQLTNDLGSNCLTLDHRGQVMNYEEYYPFGGTAIVAAKSQVEVKQRYYRYSGKEEDDTTGLYYYGMRYYCPWLGRWMRPDPAGAVDGLNLFAFVGGNPVTHRDIGGMMMNSLKQKFGGSGGRSRSSGRVGARVNTGLKAGLVAKNTVAASGTPFPSPVAEMAGIAGDFAFARLDSRVAPVAGGHRVAKMLDLGGLAIPLGIGYELFSVLTGVEENMTAHRSRKVRGGLLESLQEFETIPELAEAANHMRAILRHGRNADLSLHASGTADILGGAAGAGALIMPPLASALGPAAVGLYAAGGTIRLGKMLGFKAHDVIKILRGRTEGRHDSVTATLTKNLLGGDPSLRRNSMDFLTVISLGRLDRDQLVEDLRGSDYYHDAFSRHGDPRDRTSRDAYERAVEKRIAGAVDTIHSRLPVPGAEVELIPAVGDWLEHGQDAVRHVRDRTREFVQGEVDYFRNGFDAYRRY
ncbi:Salmonella virulence plasmid 65kDa B protein [Sulfidibacter corallicola]|uniref:RHS repeat-associated core domain-containing protein n=1 Tax=Sulfidibacter corallicola TaxID=2818388 RepID=A0A8A4TQR3_SULCO|nr:SpvB/TcaC N-terminal domain-containing protein [Sulfidibacter corallicola]QTD48875.1 hypothetical protein J3U87_25105 [Sulfidibacter corallicola]